MYNSEGLSGRTPLVSFLLSSIFSVSSAWSCCTFCYLSPSRGLALWDLWGSRLLRKLSGGTTAAAWRPLQAFHSILGLKASGVTSAGWVTVWWLLWSHIGGITRRNVPPWLSCHSKGWWLAVLPWAVWHFPPPAHMLVNAIFILLSLSLIKTRKLFLSPSSSPVSHPFGIPWTSITHQGLPELAACWGQVPAQGHPPVFPPPSIFSQRLCHSLL